MSTLEILATVCGVACVVLLIRRNHWSWPIGLIQVLLSAVVFWDTQLYAEMCLQGIFAILQVYGWWCWWQAPSDCEGRDGNEEELGTTKQPRASPEIVVERLTPAGAGVVATFIVVATLLISWLLIRFTPGQAPIADAFVTAASLTAQYLLAKKYWENWHVWIVVDIVSIPLYIQRELYVFAGLYVLFLGLAIGGWVAWRNAWREQMKASRTIA